MVRQAPSSRSRRVFVGGPIQHVKLHSDLCTSLRNLITSVLYELEGDGYQIFSAHRAEAFGLDTDKFSSHEIAMRDFQWMRSCESFVAILPTGRDGAFRTDGTHIELGWASAMGKPIVAVVPLPLPESYTHLLRGLGAVARVDFVDIREVQARPRILNRVLKRQLQS